MQLGDGKKRDRKAEGAGRAHFPWWMGAEMLPGQRQRCTTGLGIQLLEKTGKFTTVFMCVCREKKHAQPEERKSRIASWQDNEPKLSMGTGNPLSTS